jgi:hypothetical protein
MEKGASVPVPLHMKFTSYLLLIKIQNIAEGY